MQNPDDDGFQPDVPSKVAVFCKYIVIYMLYNSIRTLID